MKKNLYLFVLVCTVAIWQSCGTKENTNDNADTSVSTAEEVAAETKKAEDATARRAAIAKARAEKAEERRLANLELYKTSPTYKNAAGKIVYYKAEVDPSFVGGENALSNYIRENVKYPQEAQDKGIEGTVFVDFVVDQNGNVQEVVASDVVGENVDLLLKEEAVRVVASMPKWVAGTQRGVAVDTRFSVPITFELIN